MKVGSQALQELCEPLTKLLQEFKDVFAFKVEEMPGIDPALAVYKLQAICRPEQEAYSAEEEKSWRRKEPGGCS